MPSAPDALYQRSGSLVMLYVIPYTTSLENLDPLTLTLGVSQLDE